MSILSHPRTPSSKITPTLGDTDTTDTGVPPEFASKNGSGKRKLVMVGGGIAALVVVALGAHSLFGHSAPPPAKIHLVSAKDAIAQARARMVAEGKTPPPFATAKHTAPGVAPLPGTSAAGTAGAATLAEGPSPTPAAGAAPATSVGAAVAKAGTSIAPAPAVALTPSSERTPVNAGSAAGAQPHESLVPTPVSPAPPAVVKGVPTTVAPPGQVVAAAPAPTAPVAGVGTKPTPAAIPALPTVPTHAGPDGYAQFYNAVDNLALEGDLLSLAQKNADIRKKISKDQGAGGDSDGGGSGQLSSVILPPPANATPVTVRPVSLGHETDSAAPGTSAQADAVVPPPTALLAGADAGGGMRLKSVGSMGGRGSASIEVNGVLANVSAGRTLPNGWRVERVGSNNVELVRGGKHKTLNMGD